MAEQFADQSATMPARTPDTIVYFTWASPVAATGGTLNSGGTMTSEYVIEMFRQHAGTIALEETAPMLTSVIEELAHLLADSHERLPKETFEALVRIGGVLYREGSSQFQAKSDVDAIMRQSSRE